MRLYSWNVNGLRAVLSKEALQKFLAAEQPDVLCLQEIKCKPEQIEFDFSKLGYQIYWNPAVRPGYSGTATLVKSSLSQPAVCQLDFGDADFGALATTEGRILALEFADFYLVNVYTPNSKPDLSRLTLRHDNWDPNFLKTLKSFDKPVITCGDFNAAHAEIDLARPSANHHAAGFTDEEREGISNAISSGFIDTFRSQHPDVARYTWWSHWGHARENNVGWRIDYFFISRSLASKLKSSEIYEHYLGSDHCPISIEMEF